MNCATSILRSSGALRYHVLLKKLPRKGRWLFERDHLANLGSSLNKIWCGIFTTDKQNHISHTETTFTSDAFFVSIASL